MRIKLADAHYLAACIAALEAGVTLGSDWCPECDNLIGILDSDNHAVWVNANTGNAVVLIACEGYHVINPNRVGIDAPNWMDATDPHDNGMMP